MTPERQEKYITAVIEDYQDEAELLIIEDEGDENIAVVKGNGGKELGAWVKAWVFVAKERVDGGEGSA